MLDLNRQTSLTKLLRPFATIFMVFFEISPTLGPHFYHHLRSWVILEPIFKNRGQLVDVIVNVSAYDIYH